MLDTSNNKRVQSERWLSLIVKVLDGLDDQATSAGTNDETFNRCFNYMRTLLTGKPLSKAQSSNLVDTIRKRLGKAELAWNGSEIALTAKQIKDAENNPRIAHYQQVSRKLAYATRIAMEEVQAKLENVGFDMETLGQFLEHIRVFQPEVIAEPVDEIEEPEHEPVGALPLDISAIMGKHGFQASQGSALDCSGDRVSHSVRYLTN